jgi:hypothetical protein
MPPKNGNGAYDEAVARLLEAFPGSVVVDEPPAHRGVGVGSDVKRDLAPAVGAKEQLALDLGEGVQSAAPLITGTAGPTHAAQNLPVEPRHESCPFCGDPYPLTGRGPTEASAWTDAHEMMCPGPRRGRGMGAC